MVAFVRDQGKDFGTGSSEGYFSERDVNKIKEKGREGAEGKEEGGGVMRFVRGEKNYLVEEEGDIGESDDREVKVGSKEEGFNDLEGEFRLNPFKIEQIEKQSCEEGYQQCIKKSFGDSITERSDKKMESLDEHGVY